MMEVVTAGWYERTGTPESDRRQAVEGKRTEVNGTRGRLRRFGGITRWSTGRWRCCCLGTPLPRSEGSRRRGAFSSSGGCRLSWSRRTAAEVLERLRGGEADLAVSPYCGDEPRRGRRHRRGRGRSHHPALDGPAAPRARRGGRHVRSGAAARPDRERGAAQVHYAGGRRSAEGPVGAVDAARQVPRQLRRHLGQTLTQARHPRHCREGGNPFRPRLSPPS